MSKLYLLGGFLCGAGIVGATGHDKGWIAAIIFGSVFTLIAAFREEMRL